MQCNIRHFHTSNRCQSQHMCRKVVNVQCVLLSVLAGSAHTVLASYWSKKLGKTNMLGNSFHHFQTINFLLCFCFLKKLNMRTTTNLFIQAFTNFHLSLLYFLLPLFPFVHLCSLPVLQSRRGTETRSERSKNQHNRRGCYCAAGNNHTIAIPRTRKEC